MFCMKSNTYIRLFLCQAKNKVVRLPSPVQRYKTAPHPLAVLLPTPAEEPGGGVHLRYAFNNKNINISTSEGPGHIQVSKKGMWPGPLYWTH